jgi:hypothetical protein
MSEAGRTLEAKMLRIYRKVLRELGIDTRALSDAEIKKGAKIVDRLSLDACVLPPSKRPDRAKARADWQAFRARVNTTPGKPSSDRTRDRHSPGYMREYMRRRRAAQSGFPPGR